MDSSTSHGNIFWFPDAATFASWDVDYVKLDGCYALPQDMDVGYPEFGMHLNGTGRAMIYSCSWPVYQIYAGMQVLYNIFTFYLDLDYNEAFETTRT